MRALLILACLAVAACKQEPSFDERYDETSKDLGGKANSIEAELGRQINASAAAGSVRTDPNAPPPLTNQAAQH